MIKYKSILKNSLVAAAVAFGLTSCDDFLDRAPLSQVTPDAFLKTEADLAAFTIAAYSFPTHGGFNVGTFGIDNGTDNQATSGASNIWIPGEYRVGQTGGAWNFGAIRNINYFLETAVPSWKNGEINGNGTNVQHYIGEAYFLRAYQYFDKVQALGDFPIVKNSLPDNQDILTESSKRRPRNEVARFILADLDSAIMLMKEVAPGGKNRLSKGAALLFKSRVALHEGSWLTYHKGTARVPGGPGWPGQGKVDNFSIDIDSEIDYFLTQAMAAAEQVADIIPLTVNKKDNGYDSSSNPYFTMFASESLGGYPEVLFWRDYDPSLGINHNANHYIGRNGGNTGFTREFVDNVLMANGLPIYAAGSGYKGDDFIQDVKVGRDNRLQLFMKAPGELRVNTIKNADGSAVLIEQPDILGLQETKYVTGYGIKKGLSYDNAQGEGNLGSTGAIVFRATEAYLNYIEASYLKEGSLSGKAASYWKSIRERAGVNPDYMVTVAATDMSIEAKNDFGAYSGGSVLSDQILYNIRRERRVELMEEGMRMYDLKRWAALDQLKVTPHIIEGFKLWGPMKEWYKDEDGDSQLVEPGTGGTPNVSAESDGEYLQPYRIVTKSTNLVKEGYRWAYAHYLEPIAIQHFLITTPDGSGVAENSVIYQNPDWPLTANSGALK
ncbi:putative outer membrane starch-binding protein [Algoriphagus ratkowskyi]|uniref:Putative outer membrane starch-binding protein n=1 Tax=Algoriphagus ratkowskyi TaxID=57028 RepID=A0A2W7RN08_9BACT|nr:RagB/SusD family nutrient uptake outer membrane protein [Algoriphagus ratkowskyi]PZX52115.1 putative outer membrane starch-binding protein [Algoriphagus ratkowskyi]TXD76121.1 RagB/SusD family nutrient uptake outer membrane protein [Algoriphagus ratkowskyi]